MPSHADPTKIWREFEDFTYQDYIYLDKFLERHRLCATFRGITIWIPLPIDQVGLCTTFCSIKWAPTTKWACTPQLLVSTKWLHTPSNVLMLNVLLEWVCNPFCRKWVYRHVCSPRWFLQNGCRKLRRSSNS